MRHEIDELLLELWQDERCRACIKQLAGAVAAAAAAAGSSSGDSGSSGAATFAGFVSALLNDLMYLFKDSLERLADIKQIEDSKKDAAVRDVHGAVDECLCRVGGWGVAGVRPAWMGVGRLFFQPASMPCCHTSMLRLCPPCTHHRHGRR
jgi:hypothetical protein